MTMSPGPGAPSGPPPSAAMIQMLSGAWVAQALATVAKLGVADLLAEGPKSSDALARETNTQAPSLYRVLRALTSFGVFTQDGEGRFSLTPLGDTLRTDVSGSMRAMAMMVGAPWHWQPWGDLLYSVRTGESAFEHLHGMPGFEYFGRHPEAQAIFNDAMTGFSAQTSGAIVAAYDFSGIGALVDVGGGHGMVLATILQANPRLHGVLFDLPDVVAGARPVLEAAGVADRCEVVAGDLFQTVPDGGDGYLLKNIVHGFDEERCVGILMRCRRAMRPGGKLLLVEAVIPPGNEPVLGKLVDLEMLVMTSGGRERTETEFAALLNAAGFALSRVVPTPSPFSVVEGVPR